MNAQSSADSRAQFRRALDGFRSRLQMIGVWRAVAVAAPAAIVVSLTAIIAFGLAPRSVSVIVGSAAWLLAISIAAAVVAALQTPGLARAAAIVDRAIRGNDAVVTAVECSDSSDPIVDLIVRDATTRLTRVRPADALPFELPRAVPALGGLGALLLLALLLVPQHVSPDPPDASGTAVSTASDREAAANPTRSARAGSPSTAMVARANADGRSNRPSADRPSDRTGRSSAAQEPKEAARTGSPSEATSSSASSDSERAGAAERGANRDRPEGERGSSGNGRGDAARSGTARTAGDARGRGRAAGGSSVAARGAGGFGADALPLAGTAAPRIEPNGRAAAASDPAAYAAAWQKSQAAIARDRVPGEYRQLIIDYFTAIRPPQP